ncbi:hypothetical protein C0J52_27947 [Blattella germanica]|nr:hypothetical protein C0J52_27947 [Blattella germanica]
MRNSQATSTEVGFNWTRIPISNDCYGVTDINLISKMSNGIIYRYHSINVDNYLKPPAINGIAVSHKSFLDTNVSYSFRECHDNFCSFIIPVDTLA